MCVRITCEPMALLESCVKCWLFSWAVLLLPIPEELGELRMLTELRLAGNQLTGTRIEQITVYQKTTWRWPSDMLWCNTPYQLPPMYDWTRHTNEELIKT